VPYSINRNRGVEFRKAYSQLNRIRNLFDTLVPWFVTSATMPLLMQKVVMESIGIPLYKTVITALDRPNLYYNIAISYMPIQFDRERSPLDFILDAVNKNPDKELPKFIIYFNTESVGVLKQAVKHLRNLLPAHMKKYGDKLIQPYYADRSDTDKNNVRASFAMNICRIICATEACGMGMNVPDVAGVFQMDIWLKSNKYLVVVVESSHSTQFVRLFFPKYSEGSNQTWNIIMNMCHRKMLVTVPC
jgi:superfamily II DNA helicase RecQ